MRIVSLLPSATEIVCALGLGEHLVGISHDCDYPPEILGRHVLSDAIVTGQEPSGRIDARIREHRVPHGCGSPSKRWWRVTGRRLVR